MRCTACAESATCNGVGGASRVSLSVPRHELSCSLKQREVPAIACVEHMCHPQLLEKRREAPQHLCTCTHKHVTDKGNA